MLLISITIDLFLRHRTFALVNKNIWGQTLILEDLEDRIKITVRAPRKIVKMFQNRVYKFIYNSRTLIGLSINILKRHDS